MAKDAVATMGAVLPDDAGGRDAVHVAVFSAFSKEALSPGDRVNILNHTDTDVEVGTLDEGDEGVAIVDPFIRGPIKPRKRFWAYLYPRSITSLSHKWGHPAFEQVDAPGYVPPSVKLASEQWLRDYANEAGGPDYKTLVNTAILLHNTGGKAARLDVTGDDDYYTSHWDDEAWFFGGTDASGELTPEFWQHMENVTGLKFDKKPTYFSCSC